MRKLYAFTMARTLGADSVRRRVGSLRGEYHEHRQHEAQGSGDDQRLLFTHNHAPAAS